MRILCLTPWFPSHRQDQQGNYILDSVEALVDLGHEVIVLVTEPWRPRGAHLLNKNWARKKIKVQQISDKLIFYSRRYLSIPKSHLLSFSNWSYRNRINPVLMKLISQYQCQLIHAHTEIAGVAAVDVGRELGIPTVVTLHGISTEPKLYLGKTRKLYYEYALKNTDRVVLVGSPLTNFFKKIIERHDHFRIVANGFRFSAENKLDIRKVWPKEIVRFISVSNLQEGKGIDINLFALAELKKKGIINWSYKIIGDGEERGYLERLVNDLNLNKCVKFIGACDHNKVYAQLAQSDIFILPSYREAFGIAYLEAMSCGLLTLGVEGQGPQAFIEHGKTGLLVPSKDIDKLASILEENIKSPDKMHLMAEAGKAHVHNYFTWQQHAMNLIKVYGEIIKEENSHAAKYKTCAAQSR
jgi:teichuronic acid biosynthesis glycosyltransferase TuaC